MRKRTKYMIGVSLFALSLQTGIPGCVQRTGTLYCDTAFSAIAHPFKLYADKTNELKGALK